MSTVIEIAEARAVSVRVTSSELVVELEDGRRLAVPVSWYPRLAYGSPDERAEVEIIGGGVGLHWPQLDEDVSVEGMLSGRKSGESSASLKRWKKRLDRRREDRAAGRDPGPWVEPKPLPDWWEEGSGV